MRQRSSPRGDVTRLITFRLVVTYSGTDQIAKATEKSQARVISLDDL